MSDKICYIREELPELNVCRVAGIDNALASLSEVRMGRGKMIRGFFSYPKEIMEVSTFSL